jgi:hypothetical protein
MRALFAAALLAASIVSFGAANAADGCGHGCLAAPYGGCVVNGWLAGRSGRVTNECPIWTRPHRPCPYGYVWKFSSCFLS